MMNKKFILFKVKKKQKTSVSVTEGLISLNASMTESSVLQRLQFDKCFNATTHKSSTVVTLGCSSKFARSHPDIFLMNCRLKLNKTGLLEPNV